MNPVILLLLVLLASLPAGAAATPRRTVALYDAAIHRIEAVYLWREDLLPGSLLLEAARRLVREVDWLMMEEEAGGAVRLIQGDGPALGRVTAFTWEDLPRALLRLEELVRSAGRPLPEGRDISVRILEGVTDALDRHSRVLHGDRLAAFDQRLKGETIGIGCRLGEGEGGLRVREVIRDSPAWRKGMRVGDRIVRIDGVSVVGLELQEALHLLDGPRGSAVTLEFVRDGEGEPARFVRTLVRERIRLPNVTWQVLPGGHALIRIRNFSEQTEGWLAEALAELSKSGALARGLVVDLRGNSGGGMHQSAAAADAFLRRGRILQTAGADGGEVPGLVRSIEAFDQGEEPDVPIVVLQDRASASGAEILSGALRYLGGAVVLGERSYGKGSVQKVYALAPDTQLKLTVAHFLVGGGHRVDGRGVDPDLAIDWLEVGGGGLRIDPARGRLDAAERLRIPVSGAEERGRVLADLAEAVLDRARTRDREALLAALHEVVAAWRGRVEAGLVAELEKRGSDWTPLPEGLGCGLAGAQLRVEVEPEPGGRAALLRSVVRNEGELPLHRMWVEIVGGPGPWRGTVLPHGRVPAGGVSVAHARVELPIVGVGGPLELVPAVEADGCRPERRERVALAGLPVDPPAFSVRLDVGASGSIRGVLEVVEGPVMGPTELRLRTAGAPGIALDAAEARPGRVEPGQRVPFGFPAHLDPAGRLPVDAWIEVRVGDGRIANWPFELAPGREIVLAPPRVDLDAPPAPLPVGTHLVEIGVSDDRRVDHLTITWRGHKVGYVPGEGRRDLVVRWPIEVRPGTGVLRVEAVDDQGLRQVVLQRVVGQRRPAVEPEVVEGEAAGASP